MPAALCNAFVILFAAGVCGGCAQWRTADDEPSQLPTPRMSPDAVVLEVAVVAIPRGADSESVYETIWREVDEQSFPADLRRRLAANGLICGRIGSQMPEALRNMMQANHGGVEYDPAGNMTLGNASAVQKRLQCRRGVRHELPMHPIRPQMNIVVQDDDGLLRGQTYHDAQCVFTWKTFPKDSGGVRLEITPEIHHGQPHPQVVRRDFAMQLQPGRDRQVLESLRINAELEPGQMLLLGAAPELKGLGRHFFADVDESGTQRKMLLIRLAQTQFDGLFFPEQIAAPIVTPGE